MPKPASFSCILLVGNDPVSKDAYIARWIDENTDSAMRAMNLDVLYGGEISGDDLVARALALPMMAETKAIVVRQSQKMNSQDLGTLADYLANPSVSTKILLEAESPDGRIKSWKAIGRVSQKVEFKMPYPDRIVRWIISLCSHKYQRKIKDDAAQFLFDCVGQNPGELDGELAKLDIVVPKETAFIVDHVREVVGPRADNVFTWLQALGNRDAAKAFLSLEMLLETSQGAYGAVTLLSRRLLQLLTIRALRAKGEKDEGIAQAMNVNHYFYFVKLGVGKQAARFTVTELEEALQKTAEVDRLLKTTSGDPHLALSALTYDICSRN